MAFGQVVQIDTFQLVRSKHFEDNQSMKMNFPVVRSGDKKIDSLINSDLKNRFTGNEYPNASLATTLAKWAGDQIVFLDFRVTYNQLGILSINVSAESCGAYCSNWTDYFNYSTIDGKYLNVSDVIDTPRDFIERVNKDKEKQYAEQKEELKEMLNDPESGLDESTYEWALNYYDECEKNFNLK